MSKFKKKVSLQLRILYSVLFTIVMVIIAAFYLEYSQFAQHSYKEFLTKETKTIAIQIAKDDLSKLVSITELDGINPESLPEYHNLTYKLQETKKALQYDETEIRILNKNAKGELTILLSSESIYRYGEVVNDRTGYFSNLATATDEVVMIHASVNEDLTKSYFITPIFSQGHKVLAYLQISVPKSPFLAKMNHRLILNVVILVAFYMILGLLFVKSLRSNRNKFAKELIKTQGVSEQLEIKNKDLELLSLVAKTTEDLLLITDNRGIILWINDSYQQKNGYTKTELERFIGKNLTDVSKNSNIHNIIANANAFKKPFSYETRSLDSNCHENWSKTCVNPIVRDNTVQEIIFIDKDITELVRLQEQLKIREPEPAINTIIH